jgi:hypothetical protein
MTKASGIGPSIRALGKALLSALLVAGMLFWVGLGMFALGGVTEEGGHPGDSFARMLLGELLLLLGVVGMGAALRLLWSVKAAIALCAVALAGGLAHCLLLVFGLSLSHFIRSGLGLANHAVAPVLCGHAPRRAFRLLPLAGRLGLHSGGRHHRHCRYEALLACHVHAAESAGRQLLNRRIEQTRGCAACSSSASRYARPKLGTLTLCHS